MREENRLDVIPQGIVFSGLFVSTQLIMNIIYKPIFAVLVAIIGVLTYRLLVMPLTTVQNRGFRVGGLPGMLQILLILHFLIIPAWLLIPPSSSLYFVTWVQISPGLLLRAVIAILYACLVPGAFLVLILDYTDRFTLLEVFVLGIISSLFFSSLIAYILYTAALSLTLLMVPALWVLTSLLLVLRFLAKHDAGWLRSSSGRPSSFNSQLTVWILLSISSVLLIGVAVINVQWYALIGGDLWTHAAQTAFFLQGDNAITYPWAFHFLVASLWGVSGLPLINTEQMLQVFTILPVLALFATVSAYSGKDSKIPILSALFFSLFMGLGWISYLYQRITLAPSTVAGLYIVESSAGAVSYDIGYSILSIRIAFLPAILALSCLILALRLLRGFRFPWPTLIFSTVILTFLSTASHIFETGFFAAVLLVATIFKGDLNETTTLIYCEIGASLGLGLLSMVDWLSPTNQRIFTLFSTGEIYSTGFSYEVYLVVVALVISLFRLVSLKRGKQGLDIIDWLYSKVEPTLLRFEGRFVVAFIILTGVLGAVFTIYTIEAPPFSVWQVVSSASVPWNYYPIRIGVVTFFAFVGGAILLLHSNTIKRYFELFILCAVSIIVGRFIDLLGARPFSFGENRVMDILWVATTPLAGFGLIELMGRLPGHFKLGDETRKIMAAIIIIVILFAGTASFLLLVDKAALQGSIPGYAATSDDMQVVSYIIQHRNTLSGSLTAPTPLTQFKIREMTLTYPLGYFDQSSVLPFFRSDTLARLLSSAGSVSGKDVFVSKYDVSYLSDYGYLPVLWFLAYQPAIVNTQSSFLLTPLQMNPAIGSPSSLTLLSTGSPSLANFFSVSGIALSSAPYTLETANGSAVPGLAATMLLDDPLDPAIYSSALAWASANNRTLIVASNVGVPGLFESQLFRLQDKGVSFVANQIQAYSGGSTSKMMLPTPLLIHKTSEQNATILANFQDDINTSPLASLTLVGSGHVILLSLRDYYNAMSQNMFNEVGRAFFRFLPNVLLIPWNL